MSLSWPCKRSKSDFDHISRREISSVSNDSRGSGTKPNRAETGANSEAFSTGKHGIIPRVSRKSVFAVRLRLARNRREDKSRRGHREITGQAERIVRESNRIAGEFVSTLLRVLKINRSPSAIDRPPLFPS